MFGNTNSGIDCYNNSFPIITNNTIFGNNNHGIDCESSSFPTITNNIVAENGTTSSGYYGIYNSGGNPVINITVSSEMDMVETGIILVALLD
ncbi:MAG: right-handed parallel beta-helix repeat-containing protein [bacterium]